MQIFLPFHWTRVLHVTFKLLPTNYGLLMRNAVLLCLACVWLQIIFCSDINEIGPPSDFFLKNNCSKYICSKYCLEISKAPCKRTQHCWMFHVASVCTPCCMLLDIVVCCCTKSETGQTFQSTFTPNISFVP